MPLVGVWRNYREKQTCATIQNHSENRTTTGIYLHSISETERETISIYERAIQKVSHKSYPEMAKGLGQPTQTLVTT